MKTYFLTWTNIEDCETATFKINESLKKLIDELNKIVDLRYELGEREIEIKISENIDEIIDLT